MQHWYKIKKFQDITNKATPGPYYLHNVNKVSLNKEVPAQHGFSLSECTTNFNGYSQGSVLLVLRITLEY